MIEYNEGHQKNVQTLLKRRQSFIFRNFYIDVAVPFISIDGTSRQCTFYNLLVLNIRRVFFQMKQGGVRGLSVPSRAAMAA